MSTSNPEQYGPGACRTCKGAGGGASNELCEACDGTGQQPAQPATDERGRPMTYWGGLAQPESGEVKRFEFVGRHMVEVAPGTTCSGTPFVMAADYDRLRSALTAARRENADLNAAFNAFCRLAREQQEYERAQLTAAQQRIAELERQLTEEEEE